MYYDAPFSNKLLAHKEALRMPYPPRIFVVDNTRRVIGKTKKHLSTTA